MILDLTSFKQALATLDTGLKMLAHKPNDEFVRDACVQRFEYCYELSHKSLRRYLQANEAAAVDVPSASFPALIRLGYQRGLLASDWERWNQFRQARNTTSHTYDSAAADSVLQILPTFLLEANFLLRQIELRQEQG